MNLTGLIAMAMTVLLAYYLAPLFLIAYAIAIWAAIAFAIGWVIYKAVNYYRMRRLAKEGKLSQTEAPDKSSQEPLPKNEAQPKTSL